VPLWTGSGVVERMPPAQAADEPSLEPVEPVDVEVDPDVAGVLGDEPDPDDPDESLLAAGTEAEDPLRESVR
jgi:hypothetical protein